MGPEEDLAILEYLTGLAEELQRRIKNKLWIAAKDDPDQVGLPKLLGKFQMSPLEEEELENEQTSKKVMPRHFDSFPSAYATIGHRMLLLGPPGAGKTVTILQFAYEIVQERLKNRTKSIPLIANVDEWDPRRTLEAWAQESAYQRVPDIKLDGQPLIYLFDGLDELPGGTLPGEFNKGSKGQDLRLHFLQEVAKQIPRTGVVISCRSEDYQKIGSKAALHGAVTLLPLEAPQIQNFLIARNQSSLWGLIKDDSNLLALARTPLLLHVLSRAIGQGTDALPHDTTNITSQTLFDLYISKRFKYESSKRNIDLDENTTRARLGELAIEAVIKRSAKVEKDSLETDWHDFIQFAISMDFLRDAPSGAVEFIHLKFRDFCALAIIPDMQESKKWRTRMKAMYAVGIIREKSALVYLLDALKDENEIVFRTASEVIAEFGQEALPELKSALIAPEAQMRCRAAYTLGLIKDPASLPELHDALVDDEPTVRMRAAEALGQIKDNSSLQYLLEALDDEDSSVRAYAATAVGNLNNPSIKYDLQRMVYDDNPIVSDSALKALGVIRESFTEPLSDYIARDSHFFNMEMDEGPFSFSNADFYESESDEPSDGIQIDGISLDFVVKVNGISNIDLLIDLLQDYEEDVRSLTVHKLGEMNCIECVPHLLKLYKTESFGGVAESALNALVKIEGESILVSLQDSFDDMGSVQREIFVKKIGEMRVKSAVPILIRALKGSDDDLRKHAAISLGLLKSDFAVPDLVEVLRDDDEEVRESAANALIDISHPRSIPLLRVLCESDNAEVRLIALDVLENIQDFEESL